MVRISDILLTWSSLLILSGLIAAVLVIGLFVTARSKKMSNHKPAVTTKGLVNIGVTLELAYPEKGWQELVLSNNGKHHIIAAVLLYELKGQHGETALARDVILDPHISLERNPARIATLLVTHEVIPPQSQWLVGVGVDRMRLRGTLPPFEDTRHLVSTPLLPAVPVENVSITIDGAIIEDGRIIGPQKEDTRLWINTVLGKLHDGEQQ